MDEKRAISKLKKTLMARITEPVKKVDLLKDFSAEDKKLAEKALKKLVHDRKVLIYKEGSRLIVSPFSIDKALAIRKEAFMESEDFKTSFFTDEFEDMHRLPEQFSRRMRANDVIVHELDSDNQMGVINDYYVDLCHCECMDFQKRALPCKHMYRLAHELGIKPMLTPPASVLDYNIQNTESIEAPVTPEIKKTGCLPILILAVLIISLLTFVFT